MLFSAVRSDVRNLASGVIETAGGVEKGEVAEVETAARRVEPRVGHARLQRRQLQQISRHSSISRENSIILCTIFPEGLWHSPVDGTSIDKLLDCFLEALRWGFPFAMVELEFAVTEATCRGQQSGRCSQPA